MKTVQIYDWTFPQSTLDSFTVTYRVIDDILPAVIGPKTKSYSQWDLTKSLTQTKNDVQSDLETDEGA